MSFVEKKRWIFKTSEGKRVPSVKSVLGIINKPALMKWANKMGLQGIDSGAYASDAARVGILAHAMIQESLGGPEPDNTAYNGIER
jgi:hypothetical protein